MSSSAASAERQLVADDPAEPPDRGLGEPLGRVSLCGVFRSGGDEDEAARTGAVCPEPRRELPNLAAQAHLRLYEQVGGEPFGGGTIKRAQVGDPGRRGRCQPSDRLVESLRLGRDDGAARSLRLERRRQLLGKLRIASDDEPFTNRRSLDALCVLWRVLLPAQLVEPVRDRLFAGAFEMLGV